MAKPRGGASGSGGSGATLAMQQEIRNLNLQNQELLKRQGEMLAEMQALRQDNVSLQATVGELQTTVGELRQRIDAMETTQRAPKAPVARFPLLIYGPASSAEFVQRGSAFIAGCSLKDVVVVQLDFPPIQHDGSYAAVAHAGRARYLVTLPAKQQQLNALANGYLLHQSLYRPLRVDYFCTPEQLEVRRGKQQLKKQLQAQGKIVRWHWAELRVQKRDGSWEEAQQVHLTAQGGASLRQRAPQPQYGRQRAGAAGPYPPPPPTPSPATAAAAAGAAAAAAPAQPPVAQPGVQQQPHPQQEQQQQRQQVRSQVQPPVLTVAVPGPLAGTPAQQQRGAASMTARVAAAAAAAASPPAAAAAQGVMAVALGASAGPAAAAAPRFVRQAMPVVGRIGGSAGVRRYQSSSSSGSIIGAAGRGALLALMPVLVEKRDTPPAKNRRVCAGGDEDMLEATTPTTCQQ